MKRKPATKPKHADADQHRRFLEMARETGADESGEPLERALRKLAKQPPEPKRAK